MPREPTIWVVDTSILISYLRAGRYGEFLRREITRGGVFLPTPTMDDRYLVGPLPGVAAA